MTQDQSPVWSDQFRTELEHLMRWRRDVRRFESRSVGEDVLMKCLHIACLGPSVGNSQPWRLVRVNAVDRLQKIYDNFKRANNKALINPGVQVTNYAALKLEGIVDAPIQISVFVDADTQTGHGLGSQTMPETKAYSTVCMIQSLWLLLRAHGIGLGWVSILNPEEMNRDLGVSEDWTFIGHLCIGYPQESSDVPELETVGWQSRLDFDNFIIDR